MELRRRRRKSLTMCARKWHKSPHNRFKASSTSEGKKNLLEEHLKRSQQKQIVTYRAKRSIIANKSTLELKLFILTTLLSLLVLLAASSFVISAAEQVVVSAAAAASSSTTTTTTTTSQPPINSSPTTTTTTAKAKQQQHKSITDDKSIFTTRQQTVTSGSIKPSQRQAVEEEVVKRITGLASVSLLPSTSSTKLEEEVELSRATTERASASVSAKRRQRQPRIYKLSTNPLNGKLSLPLRISINDGLLSRPLNQRPAIIGNVEKVGPSSPVMPIKEQQQQQQTQQTTTQAPFGTRAQKVVSVVGDNYNNNSNGSNETTEACNPEQNQEHGSIATSSQTLRLTKAERPKMLQVPGFQVQNEGSHQSSSSSSIVSSFSPGEVEEFSSSLKIEPIERAQPTLIATPTSIQSNFRKTSTISDNKEEISRKTNSSPANMHLAELSLEEPTSTQSVTSSSNSNESNERANSNSILSLIDDYDSKIITNRTKAQLSCDSGEMILRLNFSEPFKGIVYPDHNRLSPCRFFGDGHHNYELRLPLRGCGTRQAAPRVFVNDVIVRFHKALELEEDEVKTLICRYPPPLAPVPLEIGPINSNFSSNNQVFGNYRDRERERDRDRANSSSNNNNNKQTLDQTNDGGNSEQESQFEFIDSLNGKLNNNINNNKLPEPGVTGQIETLSENLVVAPPVGQQTHYGQQINPSDDVSINPFIKPNQNLKQRPDFSTELNNNNNNNNNQQPPPIDIFNQRNSIISPNFNQNAAGFPDNIINNRGGFGGGGAGSATTATTNAQSYFERFSSIELLFLISSLMFLVLLALGLVGSYYCFRRQVNQNKQNRASAILRRKHRYLSSLDHRHNHGSTLINPPTILQPPTNNYTTNTASRQQQQHHRHHHHLNLNPAHQQHHYSHYQLPQMNQHHLNHSNSTAPPSPDSDLSGQNLIDSKGSQRRYTNNGGGQENRAFLLNGNSFSPKSTPDNQYQANLYRASSGGGILVKQLPVVGRRNTAQQHYGYGNAMPIPGQVRDGVVSGRQQRHLSPTRTVVQYPANKSHKWPQNFSSELNQTQPTVVDNDGPLLSEQGYHNEEVPEYSNTMRSLRFKDLNRGCGIAKIAPATGASLIPAKYAFVNKARAKLAATSGQHSNNKRIDEDSSYYIPSSQLWRAKSMSAVDRGEDRHSNWPQKSRQDKMSQAVAGGGLVLPLGGTLSRHEHSGGRNNYHRRHPVGGSQSIVTSEEKARFNDMNYYSSNRQVAGKGLLMKDAATTIDSNDDDDGNGSFSDEQNNNLSEILMQDKPMSNIVLKSIEDAYITNFTEIYEQEYMKRDSTRPLALSEWRSKQPRAKINKNNNNNNNNHLVGSNLEQANVQQQQQQQQARLRRDNGNDTESSSGGGGKLVSTQTTSDEDDEEQRYQSTGVTNLRSLTELDVNFAKSLPTLTNPTNTITTGRESSPLLKPAASFDRILIGNVNDNAEELLNEEARKQRSNSVPEVRIKEETTTTGGDINNGAKKEENNSKPGVSGGGGGGGIFASERQESPDLILSPDYDYNRLEFEPPDEASKSSHNSVSYV